MGSELSREHILKSRCLYSEDCKCGNKFQVYAQEDNDPEYYTDVWVECDQCNGLVHFSLPVN